MNDQTDFTTINPFTNQKLKTYQYHAVDQVNEIIHLAHNSWLSLKKAATTVEQRSYERQQQYWKKIKRNTRR